ncbi:uncharacterized protein LOC118916816 [Manis pentadactyla]|uniref:uncharacterized protein LOC118916816 n=1 Tax=Manis pentadactyla TaxID=143292 RepID=UPI00255CADEF|nr:uncharacterized protein LOC118916816 [Manis pentadactyla]
MSSLSVLPARRLPSRRPPPRPPRPGRSCRVPARQPEDRGGEAEGEQGGKERRRAIQDLKGAPVGAQGRVCPRDQARTRVRVSRESPIPGEPAPAAVIYNPALRRPATCQDDRLSSRPRLKRANDLRMREGALSTQTCLQTPTRHCGRPVSTLGFKHQDLEPARTGGGTDYGGPLRLRIPQSYSVSYILSLSLSLHYPYFHFVCCGRKIKVYCFPPETLSLYVALEARQKDRSAASLLIPPSTAEDSSDLHLTCLPQEGSSSFLKKHIKHSEKQNDAS